MPEGTTNISKIITLNNLNTFATGLWNRITSVFATNASVNTALEGKAAKNGSTSVDFSTGVLTIGSALNNEPNPAVITRTPGKTVSINIDNKTLTIPVDGGTVYTTNNFNPDTKANCEMVSVGNSNYDVLTSMVPSYLHTLSVGSDVTYQVSNNEELIRVTTDEYGHTSGDLVYIPANTVADSSNNAMIAKSGIYVVGVQGNHNLMQFICTPSPYALYRLDDKLCTFSNGMFEEFITSNPGIPGGGDVTYIAADNAEINTIINGL